MNTTAPIPCLWFNNQAEDAATFYVALLGGQIDRVSHYGPNMHMPEGLAMMVEFSLRGRTYQALNGGATYALTPAFSLAVPCDDQNEIDRLWEALLAGGGQPSQCGWLTDRFGLSWQIYPAFMADVLVSSDKEATGRTMQAMMGMIKLDCAVLKAAFEGRTL
jgi:predicted 3-demethylubiquinone-9 3-methyltransferase (glyoxalase superfamily)